MEDFKELGNRYLKQNPKRSLITVIGCMIVATVLFAFLNFMCNWVDQERANVRKTDDFEILILTEDRDKIESIVNEDFVRSAYMGKAYSWTPSEYIEDPEDPDKEEEYILYANALHINVKNVLLVKYYNSYIQKNYDVHTELNNDLLWTYFIDDNGLGAIFMLGGLFIAFIFAIIGVGIIRNSVQLSALERIKDYGNLRCIGATKKQVQAIVFRESFILETIGIAGGIFLGYLVSIPICKSKEMPADFHFIPIFLLMLAFYGDMYFAIGDSIKQVLKVNPIEAVRGNYRIKLKKNKIHSSGIWKLIFGVEGDYAYKNIKRNNGRFVKTVLAMSFGLGTVVVIGGILGIMLSFIKTSNHDYGYYQQYIEADTLSVNTPDEIKAQLYSAEALKTISSTKGIGATKYIYRDTLYLTENEWLYNHLTDDYRIKCIDSFEYSSLGGPSPKDKEFYDDFDKVYNEYISQIENYNNIMENYRDSGKGLVDYEALETVNEDTSQNKSMSLFKTISYGKSIYRTNIDIIGYDEEDYARYKDNLIAGTVNLSPNGVLLVNQANLYTKDEYNENSDEDYMMAMPEKSQYTMTDLSIGDEITVVDPVELDALVREEMKKASEYDQLMMDKSDKWEKQHSDEIDENGKKLENPFEAYIPIKTSVLKQNWILESARQKLVDEGKYTTYVIEGIIKDDPNRDTNRPIIVVPQDKFFDITGNSRNDFTGMMFHVSNIFSSDLKKQDFVNAINETTIADEQGFSFSLATVSTYIELITDIVEGIKQFLLVGAIILVIVLVSAFNTMNTAISNIQLRRNEFSQLRALGMTKKSLLKAVVLEGGIVWIVSSVIGLLTGLVVEYFLFYSLIKLIINTKMHIAWIPIIIAMLLELIILCGTNIVCIRSMKLNIATELTRSGE